MIPGHLRTLFWDIDLDAFDPRSWPDYSIFRVLEFGDTDAIQWMRATFSDIEILRVLRSEHRLTPKSANFWALIYGLSPKEVAALHEHSSSVPA